MNNNLSVGGINNLRYTSFKGFRGMGLHNIKIDKTRFEKINKIRDSKVRGKSYNLSQSGNFENFKKEVLKPLAEKRISKTSLKERLRRMGVSSKARNTLVDGVVFKDSRHQKLSRDRMAVDEGAVESIEVEHRKNDRISAVKQRIFMDPAAFALGTTGGGHSFAGSVGKGSKAFMAQDNNPIKGYARGQTDPLKAKGFAQDQGVGGSRAYTPFGGLVPK